jgi:hypothetical protein
MELKIIIALIALGIPIMVQGYSSGAPPSECATMTPRHKVDAQKKGTAPYNIILAKNKIRAGETVEVTLVGKTSSDNFKGLMVEARVGEIPIGKFDVSPSRESIQLLDCGTGRGVS